jgi:hypothetical protein
MYRTGRDMKCASEYDPCLKKGKKKMSQEFRGEIASS